jgi:hypothetical protein
VWKKVALLRAYRASECAELAVLDTNVREIDVAIDDIRDAVTDLRTAQLVGHQAKSVKIGATRLIQCDAILHADFVAGQASLEDEANVRRDSF